MKDTVFDSPAIFGLILSAVISATFLGFILFPPYLRRIKRRLRDSKRRSRPHLLNKSGTGARLKGFEP